MQCKTKFASYTHRSQESLSDAEDARIHSVRCGDTTANGNLMRSTPHRSTVDEAARAWRVSDAVRVLVLCIISFPVPADPSEPCAIFLRVEASPGCPPVRRLERAWDCRPLYLAVPGALSLAGTSGAAFDKSCGSDSTDASYVS